jgi:signal transduction histidine kinase
MGFSIDPTFCNWDTTSTFLMFSENVFGDFIYYSHLLPIVCLVVLSVILLIKNSENLSVRWLAFITFAFTAWSLSDMILWATANPDHTMFFWSIILHFEFFIYLGFLYFIYAFVTKRNPPTLLQALLFFLYIPLILFSHTTLNLLGYDYTNCYRESLEGPLVKYVYAIEIFIAVYILSFGTIGSVFFLISFSLGNIIGTLEVDWEIGQYGLFTLPIFAGLLSYLIVKYKSFNTKLLSAQVLVFSIVILTAAQLFLSKIEYVRVITSLTVVLISAIGYFLIKSVKKEVLQREQLEALTKKLEAANERLKELDKAKSEFVSIASHQLRSPLTAIRGYASMILEGSFGKIPDKAVESLGRIEESARLMSMSIEDYLNVSRIESGNMKYNLSEFNVKDMTSHICDDLRPEAMKRNLILLFRSHVDGTGLVNADVGKTNQIIHNLINNSIKYTEKGSISVFVKDDLVRKRITIAITDTGIGMSSETMAKLFNKFSRADNANSVNTSGTGLGLYVALKMAEAMGGTITCTSEGNGKGSTFTFELPLVM